MFKVFDRKKKQLDLLENPISPVIVNELGGIGELTFSVPSTYKHLELEGYIQVENDHEYVIKEIVTHGTNRDVVCMLNIEEVLGMAWSKFISRDNTLMKCAELVLNGTGWRVIDKSSCKVKRNLYGTVTNSYNLLQMMCTVYNVEFIFDTYNKTVTFVDKVGKDAGVYFINDINLKQLNVDTHTHKYITRVIPVGKDGLTIESVNNGKNYLENKTYTDKNIYGIWQSDKHDNPKALMDDARRFLDEMAIPYETYEVLVDDLYALKGYDEFKYGLGDVVTIIDGDTETRIQQRIIQRTYNLLEPDKDTIHIANKDATFEDYYKRLQTIADMTQSVIGSDGSINGGSISDGTISGDKIENDSINSDHISSGSITSTHIKAEQILADHIMANQITTNHLVADSITSDHIQANSIDTKHLKANTIQAEHIQSNTIHSNHISSNTITAGHIQSGAITAGSGIIAEGAIGNAQISKIDAGKIEAGTIDTSKVTIQGADGHLRLKGNRMQVFQGVGNQAKERVSVGDVNGDGTIYGLRVRGADGQTVLLDENGVTSEGITDGSITNNKINEDANIDGAKLNINSVINKINTDGTEVIQGTKVEVDGTNLGVKLSEITNKQTEDSERITQAYSQIEANEKAIKLKVDEQVYTSDKNDMSSKLEKNTSEISAMKGQIALKVEQTDIDRTIEEIEVGAVNYALGTINAKTFTLNGADNQNIPCYPVLDNTSNQDVVVSFDYEFKDLLILDRGEIYFQAISTKEDGAIQYVPKVECFKNLLVDGNSNGNISFKTKFPAFKAGTTLNFRFRSNNLQGTFIISNVQVELGNKKTDWKANPADIETKVEEKISSAKAELKVETDNISQSVSRLETTTTELAGKVTNQESRLSSAEQKITDKAITSVVQESQFIKDMDGKISTNKSNISKVEQTANSISSKVSDLSGKYTEIKQTVDSIDVTGKVSFSDLSTSGRTTINGANITTGTIDTNMVNIKGGTTKKIVIANDNYCVYDGTETDINRKVFMGFRTNSATNVPSVMLGYNGINPAVDGAVVSGGTYTTYSHYPNNNNPESINQSYGALAFKYGAGGNQFSTLNMYQNGDIDLKAGKSIYFRPNLRDKGNHVFAMNDTEVVSRVPFKCTSSIYTNGNISTDGGLNASSLDIPNVSINSNGIYTTGHITGGMIKTDSYRFTNNHIAFSKNDYNNNMMNGCNWDWQYHNLVNVKVYPVALSLPTIDEPTIQTVSETQEDTLSQIKFPEVRELSVEETAPSIDISDVTNKEEITTNGDVDLIKLVYLLVKDVQELKSEVDSLKQENNELKLLLNKGE